MTYTRAHLSSHPISSDSKQHFYIDSPTRTPGAYRFITQLNPVMTNILSHHLGASIIPVEEDRQSMPEDQASGSITTLALLDPDCGQSSAYTEAMRLADARIPVLFMSHKVKPAWISWAIELKACGWISLNLSMDYIISVLEKLLSGELKQFWCQEARRYFDPNSQEPTLGANSAAGQLTQRQFEVFVLLAEGMTVKEVARAMRLSEKSVDSHKYRIMQRLKVHDRVHLCRQAIREGWIEA